MKVARVARTAVSLFAIAACSVALAAPAAPYVRDAFEEQVDAIARDGFERPEPALAALQRLPQAAPTASPNQRRVLLQAMGSIEAQAGRAASANAIADELLRLARDDASGRAAAAANLVRAQLAENAGQGDLAASLAQSALTVFERGCPAARSAPAASSAPASADALRCDHRSAWRALQMLIHRALGQGVPATAAIHAEASLALAEWAGDAHRQSGSLTALALLAQGRGEQEVAQRLITRARQMATQTGDLARQVHVVDGEAQLASLRGDKAGALRAREEALALAVSANAPRLEAKMLSNLSDAYAKLARPADALRAAERALVIVRRHHDLRAERVLINNAGLAKIGLGRIAEGKQDLARVLEFWREGGEAGRQAETLLEFGEALAAAGDARGALELYHRERTLSAELMQRNRSAALKDLQLRNDAEARQRDIELLERDNALKTEALANRDLLQRLWWLLAAVMGLAALLAAILYRRVRDTHRRLAASHRQLQAQSQRDPLTHLANRRHLQAVMARLCGESGNNSSADSDRTGFEGALLLVDIDHFKRVNDVHGHAVGDRVLVEVAQRLNQAVRSDDLVVRWGGEEFLILAPRAAPEQAEQMAARVLRIIGQAPIATGIGTRTLHVTASIGYGRFPLPPYGSDVPWEQAINLADRALFTAKNEGRNRAVGIASTSAASIEALRAVEAEFEQAVRDGRVTLVRADGPELRDSVRAA
jgi:diguanylate cyclase (GGDEF)-like protein